MFRRLAEAGNAVVVTEHDMAVAAADWIIDLVPGGGRAGGRIDLADGTAVAGLFHPTC